MESDEPLLSSCGVVDDSVAVEGSTMDIVGVCETKSSTAEEIVKLWRGKSRRGSVGCFLFVEWVLEGLGSRQ